MQVLCIDFWIESFEVSVWWNDSFLQHYNSFDNPGEATSTLEMANVGFDRSSVEKSITEASRDSGIGSHMYNGLS